jgi:hypothetical protein
MDGQGAEMLGVGLAILGLGLPATVALMRLLPSRATNGACPIRDHEARMAETEKDVAVLQELTSSVRASLIRIESKVDRLHRVKGDES